jgi:hypothetical protein
MNYNEAQEEKKYFCSECNSQVQLSDKVCPKCGESLEETIIEPLGTKNDAQGLRKQVGFFLRLPFVLFLGLLWVIYCWWWIAAFGIIMTLIILILYQILYPILYAFVWLYYAFINSSDQVLPNYWKNYPDNLYDWCKSCIKLGFPTLQRWLLEGEE